MKKIPQLPEPIVVLGFTSDDRLVLGGAFRLADEKGIPLADTLQAAQRDGWCVSLLHYFASALEHGWDDIKTFATIQSALEDIGKSADFAEIKRHCIWMSLRVAERIQNQDAQEVGKALRLLLETEWLEEKLAKRAANN